MFSSKERKTNTETERYLQRIAELEAELDAAHQLIADQQQMLKSNLRASIVPEPDPGDEEDLATASTSRMPPLVTVTSAQAVERPPIKLPQFGPPVTEIANKVLYAAGEQGVVTNDSQAQPRIKFPFADSNEAYVPENEEIGSEDAGAPQTNRSPSRKWNPFHPLVICFGILVGTALAVLAWSQYQNTLAKPKTPTLSSHAAAITAHSPPVHARGMTKSVTTPAGHASRSSGPILNSVPVHAPTRSTHQLWRRRTHRTYRRRYRAPHPTNATNSKPPIG